MMKNILVIRNILFLLMVCCLLLKPIQAKDIVAEDAQEFWKDFRTAILNGEQDKIVAVTNFPFKTRGDLDSDPERVYDKTTFLKLYDTIFNQLDIRANATVKEVIKLKEFLLPKNLHGNNKIRIENLVFRKQEDGKWLFTFAYVLEDDIKSLFKK